jgi:hypothetical protein
MSKRTRIEYSSYETSFNGVRTRIYQFWPDGVWDENKYTLEEAQKAYPKSQYDWVKAKL